MAQTNITLYFGGPSTSNSREYSGEKRAAPTEETRPSASKHRKTGVDPSLSNDFPWLETSFDESGEPGMWYRLCQDTDCRPKRAPLGKAVWIEMPCKTITRQRLRTPREQLSQGGDVHRELTTTSRATWWYRGGLR